mgnify:FL=1
MHLASSDLEIEFFQRCQHQTTSMIPQFFFSQAFISKAHIVFAHQKIQPEKSLELSHPCSNTLPVGEKGHESSIKLTSSKQNDGSTSFFSDSFDFGP